MIDFAALVAALASNDDYHRKPAEQAYEQLKNEYPQPLVEQLVLLLRGSPDEATRAFASVLLRRLVDAKNGVYAQLDATTQATLKAQVLEAVSTEPVAHIRRKLGFVMADLAAVSEIANQPWPEVLAVVSALSASSEAALRETALNIIASLTVYARLTIAPHRKSLATLFTSALNDPSGEVQVATLKAASAFLLMLETQKEISAFAFIIVPMLRILKELLQAGEDVMLRDVLQSLVQLAKDHPKFFCQSLDDVALAMFAIVSAQLLDSETRALALEFVVSLCENAGAMVRTSSPSVPHTVVPLVIELQTEVEEDSEWTFKFDARDETICDAAAAAIYRLSTALGGSVVVPLAIPVITSYLQDEHSKKRRAALSTICHLGEGFRLLTLHELDNVIQIVVVLLRDAHRRVQYAAVFCVGQLTKDFGEVNKGKNFQARYHKAVLPALTRGVTVVERAINGSGEQMRQRETTHDTDIVHVLEAEHRDQHLGDLRHVRVERALEIHGTLVEHVTGVSLVLQPACDDLRLLLLALATDAGQTKSFEDLRLGDIDTAYIFQVRPTLEPRGPTPLLECDVLRAVGVVVLNEPHWWTDLHDNVNWKRKKQAIPIRVAHATLQDAAAHVLNWMAPFVRYIAETMKPEDMKLSLLVDKWPTEFADSTRIESDVGDSSIRFSSHSYS